MPADNMDKLECQGQRSKKDIRRLINSKNTRGYNRREYNKKRGLSQSHLSRESSEKITCPQIEDDQRDSPNSSFPPYMS
jgi:SOS-response transcriptional repressor LexA